MLPSKLLKIRAILIKVSHTQCPEKLITNEHCSDGEAMDRAEFVGGTVDVGHS